MKRLICLILTFSLLLAGCTLSSEGVREPIRFFYLRSEYQYDTPDGVIASEIRDAASHAGDLTYLLALYLIGPSQDDLVCPLPQSTRIYSAEVKDDAVLLTLSDTEKTMADREFSLACACLALTCMEITGLDAVTIQSGERSVTMTSENLTLYDSGHTAATEETQ